jgi:phage shock protein C
MEQPKLMRSQSDKVLAGVCGGLAAYLGIDSIIVRLAFLLLVPASGLGLLVYLVLAVIMPEEGTADVAESRIRIMVDEGATGGADRQKRAHPQGPTIAGILLVLIGLYLLLDVPAVVFWSLLLVALGFYLLVRRR